MPGIPKAKGHAVAEMNFLAKVNLADLFVQLGNIFAIIKRRKWWQSRPIRPTVPALDICGLQFGRVLQ